VLAWIMAALYTGAAVVYVAVRPHAVRLDRVLYAALTIAQAVAAVFGAVAVSLMSAHGAETDSARRAREAASFFLIGEDVVGRLLGARLGGEVPGVLGDFGHPLVYVGDGVGGHLGDAVTEGACSCVVCPGQGAVKAEPITVPAASAGLDRR
jgi:hypothetical protein